MYSGDEFYDDETTADINPEWPDPMPTESQVIADVAKYEYERLSPDAKAEADARWAAMPEWRKQDLRDEIEFDLL
jgi:hypothetical protein